MKRKKRKRKENNNNKNNNKKTEVQKKIDEGHSCHVIANDKNAIYFLFLKHFIDILFLETTRCVSF